MDRAAFDAVARAERDHWFFRGRRRVIEALMERHFPPRPDRWILDVGTGTGGTIETLRPYGQVTGIEYATEPLSFCNERVRGYARLVRGSATKLPFAGGAFDLVTAFDVIEHIGDDRAVIQEVRRVLKRDGAFLCLVPAHPWLWSEFDEFSHHQRRYTEGMLKDLVAGSGLGIERLFYINSILFVPVVVVRCGLNALRWLRRALGFGSDHQPKGGELNLPPSLLNRALAAAFGCEARLAPRIDIPFGVTLVCIARKQEA